MTKQTKPAAKSDFEKAIESGRVGYASAGAKRTK
jgi:hypothetical protein